MKVFETRLRKTRLIKPKRLLQKLKN